MKTPYKTLLSSLPLILSITIPQLLQAQSNLENPAPGSYKSGISLVSGWKCTAGTITVTFDNGPPIQVPYGSTREDTQGVWGREQRLRLVVELESLRRWHAYGAGLRQRN